MNKNNKDKVYINGVAEVFESDFIYGKASLNNEPKEINNKKFYFVITSILTWLKGLFKGILLFIGILGFIIFIVLIGLILKTLPALIKLLMLFLVLIILIVLINQLTALTSLTPDALIEFLEINK
jgi:hypothetical protein